MSTTTTTTASTLVQAEPMQLESSPGSIVLSGASSAEHDESRMVRFDGECVLIPDRHKPARELSRTYSLPLWRRRHAHAESQEASTSSSPPSEDDRVMLKVPIPRFIAKVSRSPSRSRNTPTSPTERSKPLSPCLVHRSPSSPPVFPSKPIRRSSLPITYNQKHKDEDVLTVPLRPCCPNCFPVTDQSLKEGDDYKEKFTRGARRRRSASLDNSDNMFSPLSCSAGFSPVTLHNHSYSHGHDQEPAAVVISNSATRYTKSAAFSITVDEVDKRRRSQELTEDDLVHFRAHPTSPRVSPSSHVPFTSATTTTTTAAAAGRRSPDAEQACTLASAPDLSYRARSSPIEEEDEDQLFPLPSPRRTPSTSPSASPAASTRASPVPSPAASSTHLTSSASGSPAAGSKDDFLAAPAPRALVDGTLERSISRKPLQFVNGLENHPKDALSSTSHLLPTSPPALSLTIPNSHTSPSTGAPAPLSLVGGGRNVKPSSPISIAASPTESSGAPRTVSPVSSPSPPTPRTPTFPSGAQFSPSMSPRRPHAASPGASSPSKTRKTSLSYFKEAIKGAGVDVLRGVSSISGSGAVGAL